VLAEIEAQDVQASWDYDSIWALFHKVIADLRYKRKPQLITPLRHAITGRTVSCSLPAHVTTRTEFFFRQSGASLPLTMSIIGRDACLARLQAGLELAGHRRSNSQSVVVPATRTLPNVDELRPNIVDQLEQRGFVAALTK
jgi:hypothetical protein